MVIFRKERKKNCKQEHTLHFGTKSRSLVEKNPQFFLPLVPLTRCWGEVARLWGLWAAPLPPPIQGKGGEGLQ